MKCSECGSYSDQKHKAFCKSQYRMTDPQEIALAQRYEPRTKYDPQARFCFASFKIAQRLASQSAYDATDSLNYALTMTDRCRQTARNVNADYAWRVFATRG